MRNRGSNRKVSSVTFNFSGDKAREAATALFIQWLDGGMADGFEDYLNEAEGLDLIHDWDDSNKDAYVFHIKTVKSGSAGAK